MRKSIQKLTRAVFCATLSVSLIACGSDVGSTSTAEDEEESVLAHESAVAEEDTHVPAQVTTPLMTYAVSDYVTLGDYEHMVVTLEDDYSVTDEEVIDNINYMLSYQSVYETTDKQVVEEGDTANIDYEGKKDGIAFAGGTAQDYNLTIGSHTFIDGFEDGLIGVHVGETVDLNLTFPENYGSEELAGQDVVFTVTVNGIVEQVTKTYDELDDAFVAENIGYESVAAYFDAMKQELAESNASAKESDTRKAVLDKLMEEATVTLPDGLLDEKVEEFAQMFSNQSGADDISTYLADNYSMTYAEFKTQVTSEMESSVPQELVLEALADALGVTVSDAELEEYIDTMIGDSGYEDRDEVIYVYSTNYESAEDYLRKNLRYTNTLTKLVEMTEVREGS